MVVSPEITSINPDWYIVTIPFFMAISLIEDTGGLVSINLSMSESIRNASNNPFLPLYPVKLQAGHPPSFILIIPILFKSGIFTDEGKFLRPLLISDNSFGVGFAGMEHF